MFQNSGFQKFRPAFSIITKTVTCYIPAAADKNARLSLHITKFLKSESHSVMSNSLRPNGLYSPWNSPGQNTGVGSLSFRQGIFWTQGSNPGLPNCRWILCQLIHKGRTRILKWVAYPFSRGSYRPRNRTGVSCIACGFFTNWAIREASVAIEMQCLFPNSKFPSRTSVTWLCFCMDLHTPL